MIKTPDVKLIILCISFAVLIFNMYDTLSLHITGIFICGFSGVIIAC